METRDSPPDEPDPDSTVDERRIVVVDCDSGRVEGGGSHRSRLREREGGEGERGNFPCDGGCAIIIVAYDQFADHGLTRAQFSKILSRENVERTHGTWGMDARRDES